MHQKTITNMDWDPYYSCPAISCTSSSSSEPLKIHTIKPTNTKKSLPSKYKGVVPQPNGRWSAQLYQDNKRVWIGTFDCKDLAAYAYDLAVIRFRGQQAITNFPIWRYSNNLHLDFLSSHSKIRVIDMLRNQTYQDELIRFKRARFAKNHARRAAQVDDHEWDRLFEKVLTPSDVGKVRRLVIPKHYAENYLPKMSEVGGMMLCFEDRLKDKMWRLKYCYWNSSQNYVLTKGWGEFVKDKGLKHGDSVVFYSTFVGSHRRFCIDIKCKKVVEMDSEKSSDGSGDGVALACSKNLRLFGVDIICPLN